MYEKIGDRIEVTVLFKKDRIIPLSFSWRGFRYRIKNINYYWKRRWGDSFLHYFAVQVGKEVFEVCFNIKELSWYLTRVYLDG